MRSIFVAVPCVLLVACSDGAESPSEPARDSGAEEVVTETGAVDTGAPTDSAAPIDTGADAAKPDFTDEEWATIKTLSPLGPVPADPTNKYADDDKAAALGQMLFFDKSYSGALAVGDDGTNGGLGAVGETGKVSCASCHMGPTMDDDRTKPNHISLGTDYGTRNTLSIVNSSYYAWTNWGGRFDSQWSLPLAVAENARIMKSSRLQIAHLLFNKYRAEYDAIFPDKLPAALDPTAADAARFPATGKPKAAGDPDGAWEGMTADDRAIVNRIFANYGKAIAAYMRKLVSRNAPLDRYVAGDASALSAAQKRGLGLFVGKAACVSCHSGPNLADDKFHALAVPQTGARVPAADLGRFADVTPLLASPFNTSGAFSDSTTTGKLTGLMAEASQKGQFRTKSLRGVAASGPYMHAGQHATLADVMAYYQRGGDAPPMDVVKDPLLKPVALAGTDLDDLVELMKAFSGEPVPAALRMDTAK